MGATNGLKDPTGAVASALIFAEYDAVLVDAMTVAETEALASWRDWGCQ